MGDEERRIGVIKRCLREAWKGGEKKGPLGMPYGPVRKALSERKFLIDRPHIFPDEHPITSPTGAGEIQGFIFKKKPIEKFSIYFKGPEDEETSMLVTYVDGSTKTEDVIEVKVLRLDTITIGAGSVYDGSTGEAHFNLKGESTGKKKGDFMVFSPIE